MDEQIFRDLHFPCMPSKALQVEMLHEIFLKIKLHLPMTFDLELESNIFSIIKHTLMPYIT